MKEFLLLVRPDGGHLENLTSEEKQQHLNRVMTYIDKLVAEKKLVNAQPLSKEGALVKGKQGRITDGPFIETKEEIAGYFLIMANDIQEAIKIARQNPMFQLKEGGIIEVRPIQTIDNV